MNIIGNKVYLRALEEKDCDMLLKLINDPETEKMIGGYSFPISKIAQKDWLTNKANAKNCFRCAIVPNDNDDNAIGTIVLSDIDEKNATAEIHIKIINEAKGKGYAFDSVIALVKYAFTELRLNCIYSNILSKNEASNNLFKKCGFTYEGTLRSRIYKDGNYQDIISYSITNE